MISMRFVPLLCALTAVTLVPTLIHSYSDMTISDGRRLAAIPESLSGYSGNPSGRHKTWGQRRFGSDDWIERMYRSGSDEVRLTIIRSYDAKSLYHHPELAVSYGPSYTSSDVKRFAQRPDVPVHVLYAPSRTVVMYVLLYGDRFVEDPIRFQLGLAGELLFGGRQPMTLFFLTDDDVPPDTTLEALPSIGLFFEAIDRFSSS